MINSKTTIYLASKSPRRKDMLHMMGINFQLVNADIDEQIIESHSPLKNVKRLALEKCNKALNYIDRGIIIAADTIVVIDGEIIGKPCNKKNAKEILRLLSGRKHKVYTGYALANSVSGKIINHYAKTSVYFNKLSDKEITDYIKTGSPMDKAGAYGIQDDFGAVFVKKISGCYYNVLGFPASEIYQGLKSIL